MQHLMQTKMLKWLVVFETELENVCYKNQFYAKLVY